MHDAKENCEKKNAQTPGGEKHVKVSPPIFVAVFFRVMHNGLRERGTTCSLFGSEALPIQLFISSNTGSNMLI